MDADIGNLKVFTGGGQSVQAASGELADRIKDLVYEYAGRLPVAAAIGALEIVKHEIMDMERK